MTETGESLKGKKYLCGFRLVSVVKRISCDKDARAGRALPTCCFKLSGVMPKTNYTKVHKSWSVKPGFRNLIT